MALTKVSTDGIKDDAITSGKIPANAIGNSELAVNSVQGGNITNSAISNDKVHPSANIAGSKLADNSISLAKLEHGTSSNDGKFLRANNGADPSFETVNIPAGTTINNNADNRLITGSGTANTLNGEARLTFDGSLLNVSGYNSDNPLILDTDNGNGAHMRFQQQGSTKHYLGCGGGISLGNANSLSMRSTDHIHFATGNVSTVRVSILNGGGLSFNGDTAAANALDDYEEGTWTPGLKGTGSNPAISYIVQRGYYSKIGSLVHVWFDIAWNSKSGGSGNFIINPLPFATGHTYYHGFGIVTHGSGLSDGGHGPRGIYANANSTSAYVIQADENFYVVLTSHLANNGHIFGGFTYRVNT